MAAAVGIYRSDSGNGNGSMFADPFSEELMIALQPFIKSASPSSSSSPPTTQISSPTSSSSTLSFDSSPSSSPSSYPFSSFEPNYCSTSNTPNFSQGFSSQYCQFGCQQVGSIGLNQLSLSQIQQIQAQIQLQNQQLQQHQQQIEICQLY